MDQQFADLREALLRPFEPSEVKWKAQTTNQDKTRALAVAFVDARVVMDRLDDAFGPDGWQDAYAPQPDGSVLCTLRCRFGGEWVSKQDVGGQSEQPDEHDKDKAAVSDALKRTAVKFGVGRYLYRLPSVWVDYDAKKRQLASTPGLPAWALPPALPGPAKAARKEAAKAPAAATAGHAKPAAADNGGLLTAAQAEEVRATMVGCFTAAQLSRAKKRFLEHFALKALGDLPAGRYAEALEYVRGPLRAELAPAAAETAKGA